MSPHHIPWKILRTLYDRVDNNQVTGKYSYAVSSKSTLPNEWIYVDDTDLMNDCAEKEKRRLQLVTPTFAELNLQINDTKTKRTVLKIGDKKNEECRSTKKLGSLIGDQEDKLRREQLSTTALHNLNNIRIRKNTMLDKVLVDFSLFSTSFLHHKWNGTRLLSPESKCASCPTSCRTN